MEKRFTEQPKLKYMQENLEQPNVTQVLKIPYQ